MNKRSQTILRDVILALLFGAITSYSLFMFATGG